MSDLIGRRLDRYEIVSLLGAGGMGQVYRARDLDLKREVAVKVIPDLAESDPSRLARFKREIHAVAGLSHPNVVAIHDFGSVDGIAYAVMELLKGKDLRQFMRRRKLPLGTALEIGVAVARGLGEAHHHGVVHRDIKPENIFVTSTGVVKILDFGIARLVAQSSPDAETEPLQETLTLPGTIVGTTGYQSPEQIRGLEIDARTDIFSLGCVLYEMMTGVNPFRRETRVDTLSAILEHEPERLMTLLPDAPPAIDLIVGRCLQKDPTNRFESARDVAFAMEALSESRSGPQIGVPNALSAPRRAALWAAGIVAASTIAVVGFLGLRLCDTPVLPEDKRVAVSRIVAEGGDESLQVLADGLTATAMVGLALVSSQTHGEMWSVPIHAIDEECYGSIEALRKRHGINVGVIGRLEREGDRLRLGLALIDPINLETLRETSIEDDPDNLISFQQEPVISIVRMMGIEPSPATIERLNERSTNHAIAFSSFLQAAGLMIPVMAESDAPAVEELLRRAIDFDPRFAPAREAWASFCLERTNSTGDQVWIGKGLKAIEEILNRTPTAPAYSIGALLHEARGDHPAAADLLAGGTRWFPDDGFLHLSLGTALEASNRPREAELAYERAINLLTGYWEPHFRMGLLDYYRGRYDAAANQWRAAIRCAPEFDGGYTNLGMAYYMLDRRADAREMFERAVELSNGSSPNALSALGTLYFEESRFAEAAEVFERALEVNEGEIFKDEHGFWGNLGQAYAATRNPERAEAPLRRAIELAEAAFESDPGNPILLAALASYHATLGENERAISYLDQVVALGPTDPNEMAVIGEAYEDIGMRTPALEWIGRAIAGGVPASRFENRPSMRGLIDDPRYQEMVPGAARSRSPKPEGGNS